MLRIVRVLAPNPGLYTLDGTNTWIVGENPAAIVDPGPDDADHLYRVQHEAGEISAILLTHGHEDHAPGAALLAEATDAPVMAFRPPPDGRKLRDGEEIAVGGATLTAWHTPGHSPDSMVFSVRQVAALFTGDSVLGTGTSVIDPPDGDLAQYLRSLRRMQQLRSRVIYPGHGPVVPEAGRKLDEYLAHRIEREQQILASLEDGLSTVDDMVLDIYEDYPPEVQPLAARSVLAHLLKLEKEGRVERFRDEDLEHWEIAGERQCERCGAPVTGRSRLCDRCSLEVLQERPEPAMLEDWPMPERPRATTQSEPDPDPEPEDPDVESDGHPEPDDRDVQPDPAPIHELVGEPDPYAEPPIDERFSWLWGDEPEPEQEET
ncbi:MAG: MBL fold metallo-hydrolase [Planctomycetaceae bacterium]